MATATFDSGGIQFNATWTVIPTLQVTNVSSPETKRAVFNTSSIPAKARVKSVRCYFTSTPSSNWTWKLAGSSSDSVSLQTSQAQGKTSVSVTVSAKKTFFNSNVPGTFSERITSPSIKLVIDYDIPQNNPSAGKGNGNDKGKEKVDPDAKKDNKKKKAKEKPGGFPHPDNQIACIYDEDKGIYIMFDGVLSYEASSQVKMEEDTSNQKGYDFVNNALIQPDEVVLKVAESDVYTNIDSVTTHLEKEARPKTGSDSRSRDMYLYLKDLQTDRRKVTVLTKYCSYNDMVLQSLAISVDDTNSCGWTGSIGFRQYLVITKSKSNDTSNVLNGSSSTSKDSRLYSIFGKIA